MSQTAKITLGPSLALVVYALCDFALGLDYAAAITAAITALCAAWWCTEAVPIPVTSLVPFAAFPLAGVLTYDDLAGAWGNKFILLFMGGFMLSRAAEHSNTHLRLASVMMRIVGTNSNRRVVLGFMLASAFCSMWISNIATTLILLPVAIAVIRQNADDHRFAVCLLLGIAYSASIGGMATIIGTAPNGVFVSVYSTVTDVTVDFLSWMRIGVPVAALMLVACAIYLTSRLPKGPGHAFEVTGPWTPAQVRVLAVLAVTVLLWITRKLPGDLDGWSDLLNTPFAHDATIALLAVITMFIISSGTRNEDGKAERLLDWKTASDIPWGILLLFAGGLAIAAAFSSSGLASDIGDALGDAAGGMPLLLLIALICLVVTFTTELTSNTATTTLLMPILAAVAHATGLDPAVIMIPAALSASCAFMLPVATPPNAVVFAGSDRLDIPTMARYGVVLNLIGVVIISLTCYLVLDRETGLGLGPTSPANAAPAP